MCSNIMCLRINFFKSNTRLRWPLNIKNANGTGIFTNFILIHIANRIAISLLLCRHTYTAADSIRWNNNVLNLYIKRAVNGVGKFYSIIMVHGMLNSSSAIHIGFLVVAQQTSLAQSK